MRCRTTIRKSCGKSWKRRRQTKSATGSIEQKIGDFYSACMNTDAIDAAGIKPIEPELERIAAIANLAQLQDEVAHLQSQGTRVLFSFRFRAGRQE